MRSKASMLPSPALGIRAVQSNDVDEISVDLLCRGLPLPLPPTQEERLQVVLLLTQEGFSSAQIAKRLRVHSRTVQRARQTLRERCILPVG
jgi:DNA-binding NarL/FixJ family response regulator